MAELLRSLEAPRRLAAHLRAVHDVAVELADWVGDRYPDLAVDRNAVLFGAATHDMGKTVHPEELSEPGSAHEAAGRDVLLEHGFTTDLARFVTTHASWDSPDVTIEELLVSTADKIWKDKRVPDLEDRLVQVLAAATGREPWEEYLALDDLLTQIGTHPPSARPPGGLPHQPVTHPACLLSPCPRWRLGPCLKPAAQGGGYVAAAATV
ncbi:HD domain-containing protein [Streptomyces sp. NPDC047023]|uniref:HD domain-containing protein n=1 Tax=Streptomyces sp. NPDC047023 TaxID=3155139 RepID=UPI0033F7F532